MTNTSTTSVLKDIQAEIVKLGEDRDVLKQININPEGIQRLVEKYKHFPEVKLFDHFYDEYKLLQHRVEDIENQEKDQVKEILESIQSYFKACIKAASTAGQQLTDIVKNKSCFSVEQVRADLNWLKHALKIMVMIKGDWSENDFPSEKALKQLSTIESDFFELEDKFKYEHQLIVLGFDKHIEFLIEVHWLLADSRIDTDSLTKDYPISVRI